MFLERGFEFESKNVFIVSCFGNCEVYDFLRDEVGIELYTEINHESKTHYKIPKGCTPCEYISPLEYAFSKARFEAWAYLIKEYHKDGVFDRTKQQAIDAGFTRSGKELIQTSMEMFILAAEYRIEFRSDRQTQKQLKKEFATLLPSKLLDFV